MKNFFLKIGRDFANYGQLYLMIIIVIALIVFLLDAFGVLDLSSLFDSLIKDKPA